MSVFANLSNANKAKAKHFNGTEWLQFETDAGDTFIVFMPHEKAVRMAEIFNGEIAKETEAA